MQKFTKEEIYKMSAEQLIEAAQANCHEQEADSDINYDCYDCESSKRCKSCEACTNCKDCYKCNRCVNCTFCICCDDCIQCHCSSLCKRCTRCYRCVNCKNCFDCFGCNSLDTASHHILNVRVSAKMYELKMKEVFDYELKRTTTRKETA